MTYCTINADGTITIAPRTLAENGLVHYHPPDALYAARGYLAVVNTALPEQTEGDATVYASHYEAQNGQAVQVWEAVEPTEPQEAVPTLDERVSNLEETVDVMLTGGAT